MEVSIPKLEFRDGIVYNSAVSSLYGDNVGPERLFHHTDASYGGQRLTIFNPTTRERCRHDMTKRDRTHTCSVKDRAFVAARFWQCAGCSMALDEPASGAAGR